MTTQPSRERSEAAVRLVMAALEGDNTTARTLLHLELGDHVSVDERVMFTGEVANVAEALARQWETGTTAAVPVVELMRVWLDGTAAGVFRAAMKVPGPLGPRTRRGRRAARRRRR